MFVVGVGVSSLMSWGLCIEGGTLRRPGEWLGVSVPSIPSSAAHPAGLQGEAFPASVERLCP